VWDSQLAARHPPEGFLSVRAGEDQRGIMAGSMGGCDTRRQPSWSRALENGERRLHLRTMVEAPGIEPHPLRARWPPASPRTPPLCIPRPFPDWLGPLAEADSASDNAPAWTQVPEQQTRKEMGRHQTQWTARGR
jgi:hypothetical protein